MTGLDDDSLIRWLRVAVANGLLNAWERKFCASQIRQANAGTWRLSPKQRSTARQIVERVCSVRLADPGRVIE